MQSPSKLSANDLPGRHSDGTSRGGPSPCHSPLSARGSRQGPGRRPTPPPAMRSVCGAGCLSAPGLIATWCQHLGRSTQFSLTQATL